MKNVDTRSRNSLRSHSRDTTHPISSSLVLFTRDYDIFFSRFFVFFSNLPARNTDSFSSIFHRENPLSNGNCLPCSDKWLMRPALKPIFAAEPLPNHSPHLPSPHHLALYSKLSTRISCKFVETVDHISQIKVAPPESFIRAERRRLREEVSADSVAKWRFGPHPANREDSSFSRRPHNSQLQMGY